MKIKLKLSDVIKEQKNKEEKYTPENIVEKISEETEIPEDIVRRILIFVNFVLYKKDGSLTNFAKDKNLSNYSELYNYLKSIKEDYLNNREIEAFTHKTKIMFNSAYSRASAWIFNTFIKFQKMEDKEKYITSGLYAQSFLIGTFGQVMENLKILQKVFKKLEKETIEEYISTQTYTERD